MKKEWFFLIESMLFLAMQVRVMAACMESQIDKQEYTASAQSRARDGTGGINQPSDVCGIVVTFQLQMYLHNQIKRSYLIASMQGRNNIK